MCVEVPAPKQTAQTPWRFLGGRERIDSQWWRPKQAQVQGVKMVWKEGEEEECWLQLLCVLSSLTRDFKNPVNAPETYGQLVSRGACSLLEQRMVGLLKPHCWRRGCFPSRLTFHKPNESFLLHVTFCFTQSAWDSYCKDTTLHFLPVWWSATLRCQRHFLLMNVSRTRCSLLMYLNLPVRRIGGGLFWCFR